MARLSHPNVVTVYEVGSDRGRDFVAMELIHGTTLAEWLRVDRRSQAEILDAFVAAGRGLAAAHAAGIVHRDFKPHNVLRSRDGRVAVTDFGLASTSERGLPAAVAPSPSPSEEVSPDSSAPELTATGSLLGTPAYMAPEQWRAGAISPATDQFAYCVALWEALSGKRPYRGPKLEDLRAQIARGPAALDASRIPRRLRPLLVRGLDPDPARRWPSMDALLARLSRARRGPAIALVASAVAAAAVALVLAVPSPSPGARCEAPARDPQAVWSWPILAEIRAKASDAHAAALEASAWSWRAARLGACRAPAPVRAAQLQCLDGALARFDALRQAFVRVPGTLAEELQAQLIDPRVCLQPAASSVPRLTVAATPEVVAAFAADARTHVEPGPSDAELGSLIAAPSADPCARVIATLAFDAASRDVPRARSLVAGAASLADRCGDDRLRAELAIRAVRHEREQPVLGPKGQAALDRAQAAANRVMQPELAAELAAQRMSVAAQRGLWGEAFRLVETELAAYRARGLPARQLRAVIARNELRLVRSEPRDLDAIGADAASWGAIAAERHEPDLAWQLAVQGANARLHRGDPATAHAELVRLWQARPAVGRSGTGHAIEGEVVDAHGRPVPGATVAAATHLFADDVGIGLPLPGDDDSLRITTTDASGRFVLDDAATAGAIAAQLGDRRSPAMAIAGRVTLALAPTRTVSGKVDLAGVPSTQVQVEYEPVALPRAAYQVFAPVAGDGSFSLSGVPPTAIRLGVVVRGRGAAGTRIQFQGIPASPRPVTGLALAIATSTRTLDVVVRSAVAAPLEGAYAVVVPGPARIRNFGDLLRLSPTAVQQFHPKPVVGDDGPAAVAGTFRSGDLFRHLESVAPGDLTICACSLPGNLMDRAVLQRLEANADQLAVTCTRIAPRDRVVVVDVPPQKRLD